MRLLWCVPVVLALGAPVFAGEQSREALDRGLVTRPAGAGHVYLSWRLLASDSASVGFNVYRRSAGAKAVKLNSEPIVKTTDLVDTSAAKDAKQAWFVRPVVDGREGAPSDEVRVASSGKDAKPYISIRLDGDHTFQKVGIADLDGDRKYDFVIKQPKDNIDPWHLYWKPSPDTYKLEAYTSEGRFLWRYDLGWAIERGIWYSPYVVYDLDGDGRDEVLLGSVTLDDNGKVLWTTGLRHPDHFYLGDIDPDHPGLEIYYGIESRGQKNTMSLVDAKTGQILWGHNEPTIHIHSSGLCSDIDARYPGSECYSGERDFKDKRWLRDAKGNVLSTKDLGGLAPRAVYWDADLQRELLIGSKVHDYGSEEPLTRIEGSMVAVVDLLGDWREEIITSVPGELRIYVTTIPAASV